jgi:N-acylneuraminate cytidylyltransferase
VKRPQVFAIIPARGGSQGIPRKNIRPLGGKPLIAHAIEAALQAQRVDRVIVNTEDDEIAEVARAHGAEVPFLRPAHLATDTASLGDVIQHTLTWFETLEGAAPDYFVQLLATSPFRPTGLIDHLVERVVDGPYCGAITVKPITKLLHQDPYFTLSPENTPVPLPHGLDTAPLEAVTFFKPYMLVGVYSRVMPGPPDYIHVVNDSICQIDIDTWDEYRLGEMILKEGLFVP